MPDVFTKAKRSEVMSRIRGGGNKNTELVLAKLLRSAGITGWRRRQRLFGRPDFTFHKERVVVFVDGCFWHACPKHFDMPVSNRAFWKRKLTGNVLRDRLVTRTLRRTGWMTVRIWEHALKNHPALCVSRIQRALNSSR